MIRRPKTLGGSASLPQVVNQYDEVREGFNEVERAYQLSPAVEKFKDKFERRDYVSFG